MTETPAPEHEVPDGVDGATVDAVGRLTKALETTERARGHLYAFHQLAGESDRRVEEAMHLLREAGHTAWADRLETELFGRNVLEGRWTFQIVEGFDDDYYDTARAELTRLEAILVGGRRHAHEEQLRERRRTQRAAYLSAETDEP